VNAPLVPTVTSPVKELVSLSRVRVAPSAMSWACGGGEQAVKSTPQ
jgi:hypothetical protein